MTRWEQADTLGGHANNTKEKSVLTSTPEYVHAHISNLKTSDGSGEASRHRMEATARRRSDRRERLKRFAATVHQAFRIRRTVDETAQVAGDGAPRLAAAPPYDGGAARYLRVGLLAAIVLVASACGGSTSTAGPVDVEAPVAAGAATDSVEIVGTYDGENCSYEGPETATLSDEISLTLVNDSPDAVILKVNLVPPDQLTDIEPLVGSDAEYSSETDLRPTFYAEASPFGESSALAFLPAPGTYVVECVLGGAIPTHVWWLAAVEVTP